MKTTKYVCQNCAMIFMVDRDFRHNVNVCPFCRDVRLKESKDLIIKDTRKDIFLSDEDRAKQTWTKMTPEPRVFVNR